MDLRYCCFCVELEVGIFTIALLNMVGGFLIFEIRPLESSFIITAVNAVGAAFVLLYAVFNREKIAIMAYLIWYMFAMVSGSSIVVPITNRFINNETIREYQLLMIGVLCFLWIIVHFYLWVCIMRYLKQLNARIENEEE